MTAVCGSRDNKVVIDEFVLCVDGSVYVGVYGSVESSICEGVCLKGSANCGICGSVYGGVYSSVYGRMNCNANGSIYVGVYV